MNAKSYTFLKRGTTHVLSAYRFLIGFLFIQHGLQKILGLLGATMHPEPFSLLWVAGMFELIGGVLLMIGLFTRSTAFVLSGFMAVAYFMVHAPNGFWPINNMGELAALYSFSFFLLIFFGGGKWSIDAILCGEYACCEEKEKKK